MIQIQIDDPDIENYFQSKESIVTLLQVIAKNEIKVMREKEDYYLSLQPDFFN